MWDFETFFGFLLAAVLLAVMLYMVFQILRDLVQKREARDEAVAAFGRSPIKAILEICFAISAIAFFGLMVASGIGLAPQQSNWFLWLPGIWIVIWVLKQFLPK